MLFFVLLMLARACHPLAHRIHLEKGDAGHQEIQKNDQADHGENSNDQYAGIGIAKPLRKRLKEMNGFQQIEYIEAATDKADQQDDTQKNADDAHNFIYLPSRLRQIRRCGDPLRS